MARGLRHGVGCLIHEPDHGWTDKLANSALCKAFAHPRRLQILDLLGQGERGVSELQEALGISKTGISSGIDRSKPSPRGMTLTSSDPMKSLGNFYGKLINHEDDY